VAGRHDGGASQRLHVERARVLTIHLISRAPQTYEIVALHGEHHTIASPSCLATPSPARDAID
jgi:hypothetical protein